MDYVKYRSVKNDLEENVIVHVDCEEHRPVTIDLGEVVLVHVDYVK